MDQEFPCLDMPCPNYTAVAAKKKPFLKNRCYYYLCFFNTTDEKTRFICFHVLNLVFLFYMKKKKYQISYYDLRVL